MNGSQAIEASSDERSCVLAVRAQPGASRSGAAGLWNGLLKVRVHAPAQDGRANEELVDVIAGLFGLRRGAVRLVAGAASRQKRFRLDLSAARARARLAELT